MKAVSRVFIIIGLVASLIIILLGFILVVIDGIAGLGYIIYGLYGFTTSLGSLNSLKGKSKGKVIAWGVSYIPVMLIASIFMFCVPPNQLK